MELSILVVHGVSVYIFVFLYRGTDKTLAKPGRKQARKHVRDARDFNDIETRAVIKVVFFLCVCVQGKAPKEIHAILTETLACFLPGRAKDLAAPLHNGLIVAHTQGRNWLPCNL